MKSGEVLNEDKAQDLASGNKLQASWPQFLGIELVWLDFISHETSPHVEPARTYRLKRARFDFLNIIEIRSIKKLTFLMWYVGVDR